MAAWPGIADGDLTDLVVVLLIADLELTHLAASDQRFRQHPISQRLYQLE